MTNIAHQLGYFETVTGPGFFEDMQSRVAKVTPTDVAGVARRRLLPANRTVGWFQPASKRQRQRQASRDDGRGARTVAGSNGARERRGRHRSGDVDHAGRHHQRDRARGRSARAVRPARPGLPARACPGSRDRAPLRRRARRRTGRPRRLAARDDVAACDGRRLHVPVGGFRSTCWRSCSTSCAAPLFPEHEVAKRQVECLSAIRQDEDNPSVRAVEALFELLYGATHPYGRRAKGTPRKRRAHHPPGSRGVSCQSDSIRRLCRWPIVGHVTPGHALARAAIELDGWSGSAPRRAVASAAARRARASAAASSICRGSHSRTSPTASPPSVASTHDTMRTS